MRWDVVRCEGRLPLKRRFCGGVHGEDLVPPVPIGGSFSHEVDMVTALQTEDIASWVTTIRSP
jgi:hypothetical protein